MWTVDKEMNMEAIFTVINTTWAVVEIRPKKNSGCTDLNQWSLRYRWSALPTELTSQLGAGHHVGPK